MLRLVKWGVDFGRMGGLSGVFVLDEEEWVDWEYAREHGLEDHAYDVLGKHSEILVTVDPEEYTVFVDDQVFIEKLVALFGSRHISGFNPLDYLEETIGWHREGRDAVGDPLDGGP